MKKLLLVTILLFCSAAGLAQFESISEKFELPTIVEETSGLLYMNDRLITHNDSGDTANLYEIDTITGNITRTVNVLNATNVDWEDIAHDADYIYIGDIGNNNGNRTDLKIYRILKSDYINSNSVTAETINFSYADQTDFSSQPNNSNFDAESISVYEGNIIIFTKNWIDQNTNAYIIPKTVGTHSATKTSSYNINGLITGSAYNNLDRSFLLCGYSQTLSPFLVYVRNFNGTDFFGGTVVKTDILDKIGLSQIEGIANITDGRYFLSREKFENIIVLTPKLYAFNNSSFTLSVMDEPEVNKLNIFPNPVQDKLNIEGLNAVNIKFIDVFDITGKQILNNIGTGNNSINFNHLKNGLYFIKIVLEDNSVFYKKIVKSK